MPSTSTSALLPFGAWPSPLRPDDLAAASLRLAAPVLAADGTLLWLEGRPTEGGRSVLVRRRADGALEDLTPAPYNVRSRVHEYGGGAFTLDGDDVYFVNFADQAIYRARPGQTPERITHPSEGADEGQATAWRFGDLTFDRAHQRLLVVAERHAPGGGEPDNVIAAIALATGDIDVLISGEDFYASPTPSPDGRLLAFLSWNHPHMPWDAAALSVATLVDGGARAGTVVAGGATGSAQQPLFADDGRLWFLLEHEGADGHTRWNLHRADEVDGAWRVRPVCPLSAELGVPLWQLGTTTWGFLDASTALAVAIEDGLTRLYTIDVVQERATALPHAFGAISHLHARAGRAALLVGWADQPGGVATLEGTGTAVTLARAALAMPFDRAYISRPEAIAFPTSDGDTAHGFFYPPQSPEAIAPPDERPPLLVMVHGGPTAATAPVLSAAIQFWTTRGFAVLDVNYRGSTGYGRRYRDRLRGQWGLYDVDDVVAGARSLAERGRVDGKRLAIRGGSAGGFTVLAALTQRDLFQAGASHYGVSDLSALARDTHKFESRYLDSLIGPWPQRRDLYEARSPLSHADGLRCPVIFFQGLEDKVVPPDQAERFVAALQEKGIAAEYHAFPGEQHGFRRADTIRRVYQAELAFYGRVFGFTPVI